MKVRTDEQKQVLDITDLVSEEISGDTDGICAVTLLHTTAALTTADLDPGTDRDFVDFLQSLVPDLDWRHPHDPDHAPSHLLSSLIGSSITVPVRNGRLQLGTWQRIVLVEFEGPRDRELTATFLKQ